MDNIEWLLARVDHLEKREKLLDESVVELSKKYAALADKYVSLVDRHTELAEKYLKRPIICPDIPEIK